MGFKSAPTRPRMRTAFAFLLGVTGLALCAWYGEAWFTLPHYSEADIDHSAHLNLAIDIQRLPQNLRPNTPDERADLLQT